MNDKMFYLFMFVAVFCAGAIVGFNVLQDDIDKNIVPGYHCQPITKHSTLEDAKAQVERYQAMVRG
jgi:glycine betaine/choline ABC-type transport system substrate-binding protein